MPEGLTPGEVGKEISEHHRHHHAEGAERRDRWISVLEAVILSCVAVLAAYSGYAAAKWGTDSSVSLARASALRTKANRADTNAVVTKTLDSVDFNAWFAAFLRNDKPAERIAERRLRPGYRPAFHAWLAMDPAHNPNAPPGPAYMPQYVVPAEQQSRTLNHQADAAFASGTTGGSNSDEYVRDTVFLATVLFLVGISGHFQIRPARLALVGVGVALLVFSVVQLLGLPAPP